MKTAFSINHIANIITEDPDIFNEAGNRDDFLNFLRPRSERESEYAPEQAQPQQAQPQQTQPQQPQAPEPPRGISRRTFNQRASALISGKWQKLIPQLDKILNFIGAAEGKPNVDVGSSLEQLAKLYRNWSKIAVASGISINGAIDKYGNVSREARNYLRDGKLFNEDGQEIGPANILAGAVANNYLHSLHSERKYGFYEDNSVINGIVDHSPAAELFDGLIPAMYDNYFSAENVEDYSGRSEIMHQSQTMNNWIGSVADYMNYTAEQLAKNVEILRSVVVDAREDISDPSETQHDVVDVNGWPLGRKRVLSNFNGWLNRLDHGVGIALQKFHKNGVLDSEAIANTSTQELLSMLSEVTVRKDRFAPEWFNDPLTSGPSYQYDDITHNLDRFLDPWEYSPKFREMCTEMGITPEFVETFKKTGRGLGKMVQVGLIEKEYAKMYSGAVEATRKILSTLHNQASLQHKEEARRKEEIKQRNAEKDAKHTHPMHQPYLYKNGDESPLVAKTTDRLRNKAGSRKNVNIPRDTAERSSETDRRLSSSMHQPFESRLMKALNKVFG